MKYKILSVGRKLPTNYINIGDYIQGVASAQFLPSIDGFVDREEIGVYQEEECVVVMNGWFMHYPKNWPPSEKIHPIFLAFHINSNFKDPLLSEESIQYLKDHEPIGCRDYYTRDLLEKKGINAFFSGCMTLTLGEKYHNEKKNGKVIFVDPFFDIPTNPFYIFGNLLFLIANYRSIKTIADKFEYNWHHNLFHKLIISFFYRQYIRLFDHGTLVNAEYICQESPKYKYEYPTEEARFHEAERLIKKYATAALVVTSRIHCALPCLALETPVLYVENTDQAETSACRLGGLYDLFNVIKSTNGNLHTSFKCEVPISSKSNIKNKTAWKEIAEKIKKDCCTHLSVFNK